MLTKKRCSPHDTIISVDGTLYTVIEKRDIKIIMAGEEYIKSTHYLLSKRGAYKKTYSVAVNVTTDGDVYDWEYIIICETEEEARDEFEKLIRHSDDEVMKRLANQLAKGFPLKVCIKHYPQRLILPTIAAMINARPKIEESLQRWALNITTRSIKPERQLALNKIRQIWKDAHDEGLF